MTPGIKRWSESENKKLMDCISSGLSLKEICKIFPHRTKDSLSYRVRYFKKGKTWPIKWTDYKIKFLKDNCANIPLVEIASMIGMKYKSVHAKAKELKLQYVLKKNDWSFEHSLFLMDNYNLLSIKECSKILDFCETTIENRLKFLSIKKDEQIDAEDYKRIIESSGLSEIEIRNIRNRHKSAIDEYLLANPEIRTSIEIKMESFLASENVDFIFQYRISHYKVDFFVPSLNLIIETDGDYWHCNPRIYKNGPINDTQRDSIAKDKRKDEFLKSRGYTILRFWECDINNNFEEVRLSILDFINNKARQDGDILDESRN
jgi:hypothetical protein|nr:MAG TPA: Endonuclease [Bacteriophage sp.]